MSSLPSTFAPRASLFVATAMMPRHLALVCAALERQDTRDFEVIFCDDGSGEESRREIDELRARVSPPIEIHHVWQENRGFRKCRVLNLGLARARGEICVFLDGDCVPHRSYVRDHIEQQEPGRYLAGRRVELGRSISESLTPEKIRAGFFDYPTLELLLSTRGEGGTENLQRSLRVPYAGLRRVLKMSHVADLKGCNYSVSRSALVALNGFDEAYEGYGREDTDVELRLRNLGLKIKSMKGLALQFHVWHPRREFTPANDTRLEEVRRSGRVRCERGLEQRREAGAADQPRPMP